MSLLENCSKAIRAELQMPLLHVRSQKVLVDREEGRVLGSVRAVAGKPTNRPALPGPGRAGW